MSAVWFEQCIVAIKCTGVKRAIGQAETSTNDETCLIESETICETMNYN